jgi:heat shock protein HspQ
LVLKYKNIIESYIKNNIKETNWKCNFIHTERNIKTKGWYHIAFYNNENPFIKWLEENVEYNENKVLKLKDVCESYLGKTIKNEHKKSKYKNEIEIFIKHKYNQLKSKYGKIRYSYYEIQIVLQHMVGNIYL